jgi:Tfp pilus assembly protein PilF
MITSKRSPLSRAGASEIKFDGCELRASRPGYNSTSVSMRAEGDESLIHVRTIVLSKVGGVEGSTISVTNMNVPRDALAAFERGRKAGNEKRFDEAAKELNKAVTIYPQYAAAWSLMAEIHRLENQFDSARKEYQQAVSCDPKFVSPYFGLATIAVVEKQWAEAAQYTDQVIELNAYAYPMAYYFNSAANFNLGKLDAAEQSARKFQKMDANHMRPDAGILLGNILAAKHQYAEAAQLYRDYLAARPAAPNAEELRKEAQRLENLSTAKQ